MSGEPVSVGAQAPAFELVGDGMSSVKLSDSDGKIRILSVIPSIDTGVWAIQTRQFNAKMDSLPENVIGYTISIDTPFAQSRWCGAEGVEKMKMLSDFKGNNFGRDWNLYIPEMGLLARSVFIVDAEGKVVYSQIVPEIGEEPNYDEVMAKVKELTG